MVRDLAGGGGAAGAAVGVQRRGRRDGLKGHRRRGGCGGAAGAAVGVQPRGRRDRLKGHRRPGPSWVARPGRRWVFNVVGVVTG